MNISVLLLDDDLVAAINDFQEALVPFLAEEASNIGTETINEASYLPGIPTHDLTLTDKRIKLKLLHNPAGTSPEQCKTWLERLDLSNEQIDLILIDDHWGGDNPESEYYFFGQKELLPLLFKRLPTAHFALFTRHHDQDYRTEDFATKLRDEPYRATGRLHFLSKKDRVGLQVLISMLAGFKEKDKELDETKKRLAEENARLQKELAGRYRPENMIGDSAEMCRVYELISLVSKANATILVRGESGTGKELVAAAVHYSSDRATGPFIKVSCAALAESVLESELFGHEKGSFTHAIEKRIGRFEAADGGTIFLDEIGDFTLSSQIRLLRVLQEREIERVGSNKSIKVDVRVIAATNRNLEELVRRGQFRQELYYRLKVIEIPVPPLRYRRVDIPELVKHFVKKFTTRAGSQEVPVSKEAMDAMTSYNWPGNVRELESCIERAVTLCQGSTIEAENLPPYISAPQQSDVGDLDPHLEIEIKKRLDAILQLSREGRSRITGPMIDANMGNRPGAFKAYCHDNGDEIVRVVLANLGEYKSIVGALRGLSPTNFSELLIAE